MRTAASRRRAIAFGFGALLEGIAGGGSPIAITAAMMAALGFPPVKAVVLALPANTAPVAFGGLGDPLIVLGRLTAPILDMKLRTGDGTVLVDGRAPAALSRIPDRGPHGLETDDRGLARRADRGPFVRGHAVRHLELHQRFWIGTIFENLPEWLDLTKLPHKADWVFAWPGLHKEVVQHAPITPKDTPYAATLTVDFLYSPGTVALIAAIVAGFAMGAKPRLLLATYRRIPHRMRWALATTGVLFPLFSAYIGRLGVSLTGSDASTNTSGGVMGKMISPQTCPSAPPRSGRPGRKARCCGRRSCGRSR